MTRGRGAEKPVYAKNKRKQCGKKRPGVRISEQMITRGFDREIGFQAGVDGQPNDDTQSLAWQRGWADAQE